MTLPACGRLGSVFVQAFLFRKNEIMCSTGNPKTADNRKTVATCQGST